MRSFVERHRLEAYGLAGIALALAVVLLIIAMYQQTFSRFVTVQVRTDRAGLLLQVDSDVTVRNVSVGKVSDIRVEGPDAVVITAQLDPDQVQFIPADVSAQVVAPTLFGPKYVDLVLPERPTLRRISSGSTVEPVTVQVEANRVFENLMGLLTEVRPARINSALGALSTALQGRGDRTGAYLQQLNDYLRRFNQHLPALREDLATAPDVIEAYADASPDFVALLDGLTTTSGTLTERRAALDGFLISLTAFGRSTGEFVEDHDEQLVSALDVLRPTSETLERYAPMFPCFFDRLNLQRQVQEPSFGGVVPGLRTLTSFQPGTGAYEYSDNLPTVGAVDEPSCFGGAPQGTDIPDHVTFDDGSPPMQTRGVPLTVRPPSLATLLFGSAGDGLLGAADGLGPDGLGDSGDSGEGAGG